MRCWFLDDALFVFPSGLVGLPQYTRYVVLDTEKDSGYQWLQSVDDPTLAIVIMPSDLIAFDLKSQVSAENMAELEVRSDDPVSFSLIVTIPNGNPDQATVNLRAPLMVNLRSRQGKQIILHESIPLHVPLNSREETAVEEVSACAHETMHA